MESSNSTQVVIVGILVSTFNPRYYKLHDMMQADLVLWWFNCKFDRKSAHLTAHWITHSGPTDAYGSKGGTKFAHFQPDGELRHCTFAHLTLGPD